MKRAPEVLIILMLCVLCLPASPHLTYAQPSSEMAPSAPEPSIAQKIAQLKAAKKGIERQARETNGYQESLRQMKVLKIDDLISRLKRGEDVPQSKIDHTIGHSSLPLYHPPGGPPGGD
jgi:hypothetical protein